jgi:hypothetical protein
LIGANVASAQSLAVGSSPASRVTTPDEQSIEQPTEQPTEQPVDPVEPVPKEDETALEWADEDDEELYHIYRKENVENPCDRGLDAYDYEKQWYDSTQVYINSNFCEPALWFDNFFATDRVFKEGVAGTYLRWRNDFFYDEEENFDFKTDLTISVELPGISDKLRLTFDDDEDEDLRDVAPGSPGGDSPSNSLGLQLDVTENVRSKLSAKITLSPKALVRYRYTYPISEKITMRLTQELERQKEVNRARTLIDYEHTVKKNFLFRSSTEGIVSEEFDGVNWLQAFVLFQRLNKKASLSYETSVVGITEPRSLTTNYRVGIRYRKNFHREWLFYEIAPQYTWPITLDANGRDVLIGRRSKYLIFFRLEVHFGNAHKKRYQQYN